MGKVYGLLASVTILAVTVACNAGDEPTQESAALFAVAADGDEATAQISRLSGVAPYFHLYDEQGNAKGVIANPYLDREFGIGPLAAAMLADEGVTVLAGQKRPGPKMTDALKTRTLRFVRRIGTVQSVADELGD